MNISKTELEKIARQLRALTNLVESHLEPVVVPVEVQEEVDRKLQARICLAWDHVIPEGERVLRGLCTTDYNTTLARIRRGEEDENSLVVAGKILGDRAKPGRKAALDAKSEEKLRIVAEDVAKYRAKKAKGKKNDE